MSYYLKLILFTLCFGFSNLVSAVEPPKLKKDCDGKEAPPALLSSLDQSIELVLEKSPTVQNPTVALYLLATMPSTVSVQEIKDNFGVSTNVAYALLNLNSERANFQNPVLVDDSKTKFIEQIPQLDPCFLEKFLKKYRYYKNKEFLESFRSFKERSGEGAFKPYSERSGGGAFKHFRERSGNIPALNDDDTVF